MNRCLISSCVGAVSTNAWRGLFVALGEVASIERHYTDPPAPLCDPTNFR